MMKRPLRLLGVAAVAAALVSAHGCGGSDSYPGTAATPAVGKDGGPLSMGVDKNGGASVDPPRHWDGPFSASFGPFVLCSNDSGADIQLAKVTFPDDAPDGVRAWVRTVGLDEVSSVPAGDRAQFIPFGFGLGSPPEFDQPFAGLRPPGQYTVDIGTVTVDGSCDDVNAAVVALNRGLVPDVGYNELVVEVPSTAAGAEVDGLTVDYTADGTSYSVRVPWTMVVCDQDGSRSHCA